MSATKKISEWEVERSLLLIDVSDIDLDKKVTAEEFDEMSHPDFFKGCNHAVRTKWLKDNGYEVTRENMLNGDLESAAPEED